jgi:hypothetical protein
LNLNETVLYIAKMEDLQEKLRILFKNSKICPFCEESFERLPTFGLIALQSHCWAKHAKEFFEFRDGKATTPENPTSTRNLEKGENSGEKTVIDAQQDGPKGRKRKATVLERPTPPAIPPPPPRPSSSSPIGDVQCKQCFLRAIPASFPKHIILFHFLDFSDANIFQCARCEKGAKDVDGMREHWRTAHAAGEPPLCPGDAKWRLNGNLLKFKAIMEREWKDCFGREHVGLMNGFLRDFKEVELEPEI